MNDRTLFKVGAALTVVGAIFGGIFDVLHPKPPEFPDPAFLVDFVAKAYWWIPYHVAIVVCVILAMLGMVAIARSITGERGTAFARLVVAAAVMATGAGAADFGVHGVASRHLAVIWDEAVKAGTSSTDIAIAFNMWRLNETIGNSIFALWIMAFFGVAFILFGLAVIYGEGYPRWMGWWAVIGGICSVGIGYAFTLEFSALVENYLFPFASYALIIWLLVMAIMLWRKANAVPASAVTAPARTAGRKRRA